MKLVLACLGAGIDRRKLDRILLSLGGHVTRAPMISPTLAQPAGDLGAGSSERVAGAPHGPVRPRATSLRATTRDRLRLGATMQRSIEGAEVEARVVIEEPSTIHEHDVRFA